MTPRQAPEPRIRDLAEVTAAETVVRLDRPSGRLEELVLTGDVSRSLGAVLESARGSTGAGFLVVGHYGSGKSHFLAAVGELLAEPGRAGALSEWDSRTRGLAASGRRSLVVSVPLVDYRAEAALEDVVWQRAWQALRRPPRPASTDRAAGWSGLLEAAREDSHPGLLILLDELSEFLRAKRGAGLAEDLRFLQFLGEWARRDPVVVLGALQESIEEVANVSQKELARIRDRYPTTLGLSMRNVEDLVRGRLVRLRPGAEEVVLRAHRELKAAFPRWRVTPERFLRCYPIHPETLTLLDGLKFLLSQQRGVVDFICRQMRGDEAAGVAAWQDRPYRELIAPDRVYDHFRSRLGERVETSRLAGTVVPYYERAAAVLFSSNPDRELAVRAVKVLTLLSASPLERRREASELAEMLLVKVSALDPNANYSYLEQAILDSLAGHGAYVVAHPERKGSVTFAVELEADASVTAGARAAQVRAELRPGDRRVIDGLAELGSTPTLPLPHLKELGRHRRELIWQNTLRHVLVAAGRLPELERSDIDEVQSSLDALGADVCLLVAEPEEADQRTLTERAGQLVASAPRVAVWVPDRLSQAELEFALDTFSKRVVLERARSEGGGPAGLAEHLERSLEMAVARAREVLARSYFQGVLVSPDGGGADLPSLSGLPFDRLLRTLLGPVLAALHPRHQEVQPYDELVGDRLVRRLLDGAMAAPRITVSAAERQQLRQLIESYLVPLGLVRKRGEVYLVAPDPARSPAVAELLRLASVPGGVAAAQAARELGEGAVGLSEPETLLLLNASVQSGLIEASKRGRQVSAPFFSLSELDRISAGELVAGPLRARIAELGPIFGQGPFEPWNARLQQAAWEHAGSWLETRRQEAAQVREAIARLAESPLFSEADLGSLSGDLELVSKLESVDPLASPREGIESILRAVPETETLLAAAGRLELVARFARSDLGALSSALGYLIHPDLVIPEGSEFARLQDLRREALEMAGDVVQLAAEDKVGELFSACDQFRRTFSAVYEEAHASFYGGEGSQDAAIVTSSPEYRALVALSDVGGIAVLDDRVKVDRAVTAATLRPCLRRVDAELQWRPLCACGFRLGDRPPVLDAQALVAMATRGVAQHLAELVRVENRERLEQAAEDLDSLERTEVAAELRRSSSWQQPQQRRIQLPSPTSSPAPFGRRCATSLAVPASSSAGTWSSCART